MRIALSLLALAGLVLGGCATVGGIPHPAVCALGGGAAGAGVGAGVAGYQGAIVGLFAGGVSSGLACHAAREARDPYRALHLENQKKRLLAACDYAYDEARQGRTDAGILPAVQEWRRCQSSILSGTPHALADAPE